MRPRPWLLLCVSLHGVAASAYAFPSGKHGLDYCIAEADTHHRHDSVDHHGTSNHMWDAYAALHSAAYTSVNTNVAGMCEHNPIHELDYCIAEASLCAAPHASGSSVTLLAHFSVASLFLLRAFPSTWLLPSSPMPSTANHVPPIS